VVATPGAPPAPADLPIDPLLGAAPQTPRRSTAIQVPGGGLVCLYTDGLVERRPGVFDAGHDVVGEKIDALCTALDESEDPESACIRVLTEVVGEHIAEDDIAVLIARLDAAGIVDGDGE
jgi:serine phosphatase RsbU (regulator of sigma subunit)